MALITLASAKSSGVTTTALALALSSTKRTLLAECDPAGGTIRTGYLQGRTTAAVGLHRLATAQRDGTLADVFEQHLVALDQAGHRLLLPGLTDPTQTPSLAGTWEPLHRLLRVMEEDGYDVLVDAGRVVVESATSISSTYSPAPLLRRADLVLLVVRANTQSVAAAAPVIRVLREDLDRHGTGSTALRLAVIEDGPFKANQIASSLGVPVVASLPYDTATASALDSGDSVRGRFELAPLIRAGRSAHQELTLNATRRRLHLTPRPGQEAARV